MGNLIHRLRQKSEHERRVAAFGITSAVMSVVFVLWATTLVSRFSEQDIISEATPNAQEEGKKGWGILDKGASAVSSVAGGVSGLFKQATEYVETFDDPVTYDSFEDRISDELDGTLGSEDNNEGGVVGATSTIDTMFGAVGTSTIDNNSSEELTPIDDKNTL